MIAAIAEKKNSTIAAIIAIIWRPLRQRSKRQQSLRYKKFHLSDRFRLLESGFQMIAELFFSQRS